MEAQQLAIHISGQAILQGVSVRFPLHKLSVLKGRSGVGKTTLLKSLSGLTVPTEGQIKVGEAVSQASGGAASIAEKTGLVFQFPDRYFLGSTIQQEMAYAWPSVTAISMLSLAEQSALVFQANEALQRVRLYKAPNTALSQLSGGEKRKLAIAVQLARKPEVLLLDEPLAGLDVRSKREISNLLAELANYITVVVASHETTYFDNLKAARYTMRPDGIECERV